MIRIKEIGHDDRPKNIDDPATTTTTRRESPLSKSSGPTARRPNVSDLRQDRHSFRARRMKVMTLSSARRVRSVSGINLS